MKINIIKARVKRNQLEELAGLFYCDNESLFIKELRNNGLNAILGIKKDDSTYTVIGEDYVYYLTKSRKHSKITHLDFNQLLSKNAMKLGKAGDFEYVPINNQDTIWVANAQIMNALWNTSMLLTNLNKG